MTTPAKIPDPNPSEWYFHLCPKQELWACCYYEYGRFCPAIVEAVAGVDPDYFEYMEERPHVAYVAVFARDFPKTPWLELPEVERKRLLAMCSPKERSAVSALWTSFKYWESVDPNWRAKLFENRDRVLNTQEKALAAIELDWALGNPELKAAFRRFLQEHRPPGTGGRPGRSGSPSDYLNALGARRLIQHAEVKRAKSTTQEALSVMAKHIREQRNKALSAKNSEDHQEPYTTASLKQAAGRVEKYLAKLYFFFNRNAWTPGGQDPTDYWRQVWKQRGTAK